MSDDFSCNVYNRIIRYELQQGTQAKNIVKWRTWSRESGYNKNPLISKCDQKNNTIEQQLLDKKKYMFYNKNSNTNKIILTESEQFSRAAKGYRIRGMRTNYHIDPAATSDNNSIVTICIPPTLPPPAVHENKPCFTPEGRKF